MESMGRESNWRYSLKNVAADRLEPKDHVVWRIRGNKRRSVREYYRPEKDDWTKEPILMTYTLARFVFSFGVLEGYRYGIDKVD